MRRLSASYLVPLRSARRIALSTALCFASVISLPAAADAAPVSKTFSSATNSGTSGTYVVPVGVTSIRVEAIGGKGGDVLASPFFLFTQTGGYGAVVSGSLPVTPGQALYVYVAGNGEHAHELGEPAAGGANGGGGTTFNPLPGGGAGGGGGASDVRTIAAPTSGSQTASLESRLLVAAGGGGAAVVGSAPSGQGNGGNAGQAAPSGTPGTPAQPGTANANGTGAGGAGGTGLTSGQPGTLGEGGAGGSDCCFQGAGGGAGLYGGGGGASVFGNPGAGGASWVEPSATSASTSQIDSTGEPRVTISYEEPAPPSHTTLPAATILSAPPMPPVAPLVTGLRALHRCVTGTELSAPQPGSQGLAFSFSLSEAANVRFGVLHRVGSPHWTKCPRRQGHTPSNYKSVGSYGALVPAGQQTTSLGTASSASRVGSVAHYGRGRHRINLGRLAQKHLRPGTYVLSVKAVNSAGEASGVSYVKFWVFS